MFLLSPLFTPVLSLLFLLTAISVPSVPFVRSSVVCRLPFATLFGYPRFVLATF